MDKKGFTWRIKKYLYFRKCKMPACAMLELQGISGKLERLTINGGG